ncbi:MAG: cytochrome C oxidase subunit IV family protein [Rhodoferax sp.]|uniref:cytochrome C oxidase subunit IV family protein n=1 Tax=Rhodoferax sp. TaxID=50421 RepID=UPI00273519B2|nr:cytochrome C oxidase subunit IV family protein [Rhodoferax sp.]MDP2678912.1 cytochrome C oxidase subunit IV family protein [Rhodoferax sp.]
MFKFSSNTLWLLLLTATGLTYGLGESGELGRASMASVFLIFGFALFKGLGVILDFMDLRHAPALWRNLLLGWLVFVMGMILLAYWIGQLH